MNYTYISSKEIADIETVLPVTLKVSFNQSLRKKNKAKRIKKEKANKEAVKKVHGSNRNLFGAKKVGSSKDTYIFILSDTSNIELYEKEESSGSNLEKIREIQVKEMTPQI